MAKAKENLTVINFFQDKIKKSERNISLKDLTKLSIDTSQATQHYRNITLKKDFLGDWFIKVTNDANDLDDNPIAQNKKLITRLKALWENGKKEIKVKELKEMNICTPATSIKIQNFKLTDNSLFLSAESYDITLIDKNKNIDGLWLDNMVSTERILDVLKDFNITSKELSKISELDLNKLLETHFKKYFENIKKSGTSDKGLIDLIVGDMLYALELKLAKELKKTTQADRALGQIDRYMERFGANFMVIIAGDADTKKEKSVQDLIKKIRSSKGSFYYLESHD